MRCGGDLRSLPGLLFAQLMLGVIGLPAYSGEYGTGTRSVLMESCQFEQSASRLFARRGLRAPSGVGRRGTERARAG